MYACVSLTITFDTKKPRTNMGYEGWYKKSQRTDMGSDGMVDPIQHSNCFNFPHCSSKIVPKINNKWLVNPFKPLSIDGLLHLCNVLYLKSATNIAWNANNSGIHWICLSNVLQHFNALKCISFLPWNTCSTLKPWFISWRFRLACVVLLLCLFYNKDPVTLRFSKLLAESG